jgi:hypothetical protein
MLHDLVVRKIKKLEFRHILQKTLIRKIKNLDFGTPKMENALFVERNENRPQWCFSSSQGSRACLIWHCFDKLCHDQGQI